MKKALSFVLSLSFIFSAFCGIVRANGEEILRLPDNEPMGGLLKEVEKSEEIPESKVVFKRTRQSFEQYLEDQLLAHQEIIWLNGQEYNSYVEQKIFELLIGNYKILSYPSFTGLKSKTDGKVVAIKPKYIFDTAEENEEAREFMDRKIQEYLSAVSDIPSDDVMGKILAIHDLFCQNNEYARTEYQEEKSTGNVNFEIRTAYYLFENNKAVCQGNAMALKAIYDTLNKQLMSEKETNEDIIQTKLCESAYAKHIWNVVNVDGKWYHIDETNADCGDYVIHDKFLVSSSALCASSEGFYGDEEGWNYYSDETITCDNDDLSGGYIFRYKFPYFNISYEDGRYKLDVYRINQPFWSNSIISTDVLVTDVYSDGDSKKIKFFSEADITMCPYYVRYKENGAVADNDLYMLFLIEKQSGYLTMDCNSLPFSGGRLFTWGETDQKPLCRAINVP